MRNLLIICAIAFGCTACEKDAGEGGTSVIEGQVYKLSTEEIQITEVDSLGYDTTYVIIDTIKAPQLYIGKDVFIIYSDNEGSIYDDKFETDYNGRYRFEFLRKGDYTIYTYADSTQSWNDTIPQDHLLDYEYPIFRHITISSNNSTNTVEDFVIEKNQ
tara:strand:- start:48247 stop:48723 length:477 start_codon:yes stop_codon:yes gene_type:complete